MELTKYEHACFTVETEGKLLVVDPGAFTSNLGAPENIVAIVITHEHPDHFDPAALGALIAHNPDAIILAPDAVTHRIEGTLPSTTVSGGVSHTVGPFMLDFCGEVHAEIHATIGPITNVGVMINEKIFYPGDSFATPGKPVDTLALPVAAPWLKISEAIDYIQHIAPRVAFPTHDAILSDIGKSIIDNILSAHAQIHGVHYERLVHPFAI